VWILSFDSTASKTSRRRNSVHTIEDMHRTGNAAFDGCHGQVETRIGTAKGHHNMIVIFSRFFGKD